MDARATTKIRAESLSVAERHRVVAEATFEAVVITEGGRVLDANPQFAEMFGYTLPEILGLSPADFTAPEDRERVRLNNLACVTHPYEALSLRKDGTVFPTEFRGLPMCYEGRTVRVTVIRDIHDRKRTEEALRHAQEELEARVAIRTAELAEANHALQGEVIERQWTEVELQKVLAQSEQMLAAITSILIGVDQDDCITIWNSPARRAFGLDHNDVLGKPFGACGIVWDQQAVAAAVSACRASQQPARADDVRYVRDGRERFLGITINPVSGYSDVPMGFLLLAADVTERKLLESQLAQAQKLESIGQLAAGIAHELNTPIQYVGDNTRFLQDAFSDLRDLLNSYAVLARAARTGPIPPGLVGEVEVAAESADVEYLIEEIPKAIAQSLDGIERVASIVRAMKEFSHPGTAHKTAVDLNRSLESTATVARNEWKYVADLVTDFDPALPPVPCLPGELNQVFLNIIVNAAHAISDVVGDGTGAKGAISVGTRAVPPGTPKSASPTPAPASARRSFPKSSTRFSPRRESGGVQGRGCPSPMASWWKNTAALSPARAS